MKPITLILLVVGGVMIVAGMNKENPITVVKNVLTGVPMPGTPVSAPVESSKTPGPPPGINNGQVHAYAGGGRGPAAQ